MSDKINDEEQQAHLLQEENTRRNFLTKFGKLAIVTPVALTALMSPTTSAAPKSCRGNGNKAC